MQLNPLYALILSSLLVFGCSDSNDSGTNTGTNTGTGTETSACANDIITGTALGITALPASASSAYKNALCKYTKVTAPNGKPIHIYAQDKITNEQMIRARSILEFYLTNVPGSQYGADKTAIANQMANNNAELMLLNGSDTGTPVVNGGQPLYQTENVVEGSTAYINNDYENHRDAYPAGCVDQHLSKGNTPRNQ